MKNSVELIGYVGNDAEVTETANGHKVARFNLATSKEIKTGSDATVVTQWHKIVAWNGVAARPIKKGMMMMVEGEIGYRTYTDKEGIERSITEITSWRIYEIARQQKESVPMPTEDDMPVHPRAVQNMNVNTSFP